MTNPYALPPLSTPPPPGTRTLLAAPFPPQPPRPVWPAAIRRLRALTIICLAGGGVGLAGGTAWLTVLLAPLVEMALFFEAAPHQKFNEYHIDLAFSIVRISKWTILVGLGLLTTWLITRHRFKAAKFQVRPDNLGGG